ncbi:MAG TPA: LysR substrate-binding domain-containing protein [Acidobacteriaceae bacterium]|nr:LysR substrate-binding domain-containing protein [Acidobacteriaceae bacterium]
MELRHLRYFCAIAEWKGFNRAARALHVSQSAISEQILDLESEIGVPLLNRTQHKISLTPPGEIFLEEARRVLAAANHAVEMAQRSNRGEIGYLSIGFLVWGTGAFFPKIIRGFRRQHPGVQLSLLEILPQAQSEALLKGTIDIGFTRPLQPPYDQQLRSELLYMDPLMAVLPVDHRLASGPLALEALAEEQFILCDREISPTLFDKITSLCVQAGFAPRITQTSNLLSSVLTLVQAGEGVTLIPASLRHMRFSDLAFCPLTATSSVEMVMAWSPDREGALRNAFLDFVRERKQWIERIVASCRS